MRRYIRFTLCVFLLAIFTAGAHGAAVTIHGKGYGGLGDDATLSQIGDVVRFVTDKQTEELTFDKDSLMLVNTSRHDSKTRSHPRIFQFDTDGTGHTEADLASTSEHTTWSGPFNYSKMSGDVLSTRGKDGTFYAVQHQFPVWLRIVTWRDGKLNGSHSSGSISSFGLHHNASDVKAGIKLPGFDGEIIAFFTRNNAGDRVQVNFAEVHTDDSELGISINALSQVRTIKIADDSEVAKMYDGVTYCPMSMAVGDYDGDGYKNEVAVVYGDTATVYYDVVQLTYPNGGFNFEVLDHGRVFTYDSPTNHLDGIARTLSCSVVTGDFDGDGKDEFAAVVLDTSKLGGDIFMVAQDGTETGDDDTHFSFSSWTGKIHIFVHK